uniref:Uncharacterized protein n=1 Tax=Strigamia maritima TaxID=126957 RepID=T1ILT1_STRMM
MKLWEVERINMLYFVLLLNGVLIIGVVWTSLASSDACVKLEKKIAKEYECCLQERKKEVPVHMTSWFPILPSLSAASDLNLTVDQLIFFILQFFKFFNFFCFYSREIHDVACINQMLDRASRATVCLSNTTVSFIQKRAEIQEKRRQHLCDKGASYALYESGASECLQNKPVSLCMTYLMDNFDLEANKYQPNCEEFHKLQRCLRDEWKEFCGEESVSLLLKLIRVMYAIFHCSDYEGEVVPTTPVLLSIVPANCQLGTSCAVKVQTTMNEYRQCIDYSYQILFSMKYYEVSSTTIGQKCIDTNFATCRAAADRKMSGCLDFSQREALETTFQMVEAGYRYWCSEYGVKLMEFYSERAPDCYFLQLSLFRTCELEYPLINIYLQPYDSNYCRTLSAVTNCLQQVYQRCLTHEDPSLIRGYYETMWKTTPCFIVEQQYLHNSTSNLKINFHILLFCVMIFIAKWKFLHKN